MASLFHPGMTKPAALPSAGQIAPKIHNEGAADLLGLRDARPASSSAG